MPVKKKTVTKKVAPKKKVAVKKVTPKKIVNDKAIKKLIAKKAPKKASNPKETYVAIVIDRSGSMYPIRTSAISAINEQLDEMRKMASKNHKIYATVISFAGDVSIDFDNIDIKDVPVYTVENYNPNGSTAMRDAISKAIDSLSARETLIKKGTNVGFLVSTISDGEENASTTISREALTEKIKSYQSKNTWTFTYLLANQDPNLAMINYAAAAGNIATFDSTASGMASGAGTQTLGLSSYLTGRNTGVTSVRDFYEANPSTMSFISASVITPANFRHSVTQ